ncbi:Endoribonuclease EndoA [termite gut metagenome]|uniref:Endoribonuclease EndoA n=1 Tax=termite gut metagenome TaxID=433724 RepID=A0A5J4SJZ7_9ZZZZ
METTIVQIGNSKGVGSEISKKRPCVVVSPREIHDYMCTAIVIPITSTLQKHPCRVQCRIKNRDSEIATDQIRSIDKSQLGDFINTLSKNEIEGLQNSLKKMFF